MKTFKKLLAALFCIALLGPVMTSCSKNDVRDILLTSDKSWEDIVKERPFMANFPKYGGSIQTLILWDLRIRQLSRLLTTLLKRLH